MDERAWRDASHGHGFPSQSECPPDHVRIAAKARLPATKTDGRDRDGTIDLTRSHELAKRRNHAERLEVATRHTVDLQPLTGVVDDRG